jgi:hypothetical protein
MLKWRRRHGSESPGEEAAAQVLEPDIGTQMRDEVKSVQARSHYDAPNYRAEHRQRFLTRADDIAIRNNLPPLIRYAQPPNEYVNYFESDPLPEIVLTHPEASSAMHEYAHWLQQQNGQPSIDTTLAMKQRDDPAYLAKLKENVNFAAAGGWADWARRWYLPSFAGDAAARVWPYLMTDPEYLKRIISEYDASRRAMRNLGYRAPGKSTDYTADTDVMTRPFTPAEMRTQWNHPMNRYNTVRDWSEQWAMPPNEVKTWLQRLGDPSQANDPLWTADAGPTKFPVYSDTAETLRARAGTYDYLPRGMGDAAAAAHWRALNAQPAQPAAPKPAPSPVVKKSALDAVYNQYGERAYPRNLRNVYDSRGRSDNQQGRPCWRSTRPRPPRR